MTVRGRRDFLKGGSLAVGVLAAEGCAVSTSAAPSSSEASQVASFGWEASNLSGNGVNMSVKIVNTVFLQAINADLSATILSAKTAGFAEVLCVGGVCRQSVPSFDTSAQAYINFPTSPHFGSVVADNPNNLTLAYDHAMHDGQFLSVILKTWVPADGTACATSRHVLAYPSLNLNAGDYLVFHMDHQGVGVDAEMQIVLTYTLT